MRAISPLLRSLLLAQTALIALPDPAAAISRSEWVEQDKARRAGDDKKSNNDKKPHPQPPGDNQRPPHPPGGGGKPPKPPDKKPPPKRGDDRDHDRDHDRDRDRDHDRDHDRDRYDDRRHAPLGGLFFGPWGRPPIAPPPHPFFGRPPIMIERSVIVTPLPPMVTVSPYTRYDKAVQWELYRLGFYRGGIDGVIGPASRAAIRDYQYSQGLPVTGGIDQRLLVSLGLIR